MQFFSALLCGDLSVFCGEYEHLPQKPQRNHRETQRERSKLVLPGRAKTGIEGESFMRRFKPILMLAALGVFLICAQQASAAVALVQKVRNPPPPMETLAVTNTAVSFTNPPTAGNLLVAVVAGGISTGPLTPPAAWSTAVNQLFSFDGVAQLPSQAIFYKVSVGAADQKQYLHLHKRYRCECINTAA